MSTPESTTVPGGADRRTQSDRRFLPRGEPGAREGDASSTGILGAHEPGEKADTTLPLTHLLVLSLLCLAGLGLISFGNSRLAPLLFHGPSVHQVTRVLASGMNYATHDLNIDSRRLRRGHIASLRETPDIAVMGASQWQEGHATLVPERNFYNAHVHRDYYEDMAAVVEMFVRNNRLPRQLIITIRDNLFTPVDDRTDFLWVPTLPDYRDMARRLDLPVPAWWEIIPWPQLRESISLTNLRANAERRLNAAVLPHITGAEKHDTLDILRADGSIEWSREHDEIFTAQRAREQALAFAAERRDDPPRIDPAGVAVIERLLTFLQERGVEVFLAHPPFNPIYWDAVQGSPYMVGLARVEALTQSFATRFGLEVIGGFNPRDVGCRALGCLGFNPRDVGCRARNVYRRRALEPRMSAARP